MTKRERELVDEIANYIIPSYPIEGHGPMVPMENVIYLRWLAREVLKSAKAKK